jgi:hypothetical protein
MKQVDAVIQIQPHFYTASRSGQVGLINDLEDAVAPADYPIIADPSDFPHGQDMEQVNVWVHRAMEVHRTLRGHGKPGIELLHKVPCQECISLG